MNYEAGSLELSIMGFSNKSVANIDVTAKSLRRLASSIDKVNGTNFAFAGEKLEHIFTKIARATNSIDTKNLTNLSSAAKSIASISKIGNLDKMDFEKVGKGFEDLDVKITPFVNKVKEAETSLVALNGVLKKSGGKSSLLEDGGSAKKGGLLNVAKLGASYYMLRKIGKATANIVQAGSDYTETLNLWQVAMRNNLTAADEFVNKMNKAYGISTKTLMNAQATFKNMIGSLGQISDQTAYQLSEALVQMSADFSSLYNVKLESAFDKMQSMLAGQVRPIRSAGLDMTETTLYQYYQQIGGTKSMRQLNRTEKQLLSILAVYKQMGSAGALGDMTKTLNSFANQSRMMTEYWQELKAWSGLLLKDLIEDWKILTYVNAALITATEIIKAIAKSRGLGEENFIDGLFETTEATNDAIDELQGKLLDFDKFRSLQGEETTEPAIDQKLLDAISGYSSQIDQAKNSAEELAGKWLSIIGFTENANGEWEISEEKLNNLKNVFEVIGISVGIIVGYKLADWLLSVAENGKLAAASFDLLNFAIMGGAVYAILQAIDAFRKGDYWAGIFESAIAIGLVGAILLLKKSVLIDGVPYLDLFGKTINGNFILIGAGILALIGGIGTFIKNFDELSDKAKVWIPIIASLVGVVTALAAGLSFMKGNWIGAIGLGALVTGIGLSVGTKLSVPNYEMGASDIDSGTVFRAGEFGKTEAVYTGSNGKTNVANIQQMKTAYSQALREWWATAKYDIPNLEGVSDSGLYTIVDGEAKRRGKKFANV